jgi:lipoprotein-anchoring transpeptidase ErfK/SrfK
MFSHMSAWLRRAAVGATAIAAVGALAAPAAADVLITVDKSTQQMSVMVDGYQRYTWPVSTGLHGGPPSGTFHPERMERVWYSRAFGMAPMPHSIFFRGPFAIHGTMIVSRLGHPASHGCVRLLPDNASTLFDLVQQEGPAHTRIVIR